ncbi:MAG: 16S rRNA G1207 methylase RsmC, partial [Myxococcota bacterium]
MRNVGTARAAASVVLVGLDADAMGLVRETLAAEAVLPNSSISFGDAISAVKRQRPDVVIVGFHQAMDAALALAQALAKEAPNVT